MIPLPLFIYVYMKVQDSNLFAPKPIKNEVKNPKMNFIFNI